MGHGRRGGGGRLHPAARHVLEARCPPGGRAFPGWHHLADFDVEEGEERYRIAVTSRDGTVSIDVSARRAGTVMDGSVFPSVDQASSFFRDAPVGFAATPKPGLFDGVELGACGWNMRPLLVEDARSSYFDDPHRFPRGSASVDSAFVMEGVDTTWKPQAPLLARGGARPVRTEMYGAARCAASAPPFREVRLVDDDDGHGGLVGCARRDE